MDAIENMGIFPEYSDIQLETRKNVGYVLWAQMIVFGSHIISVILLGRLIGPRGFGLVAIVTSITFFFINYGVNGFTEYVIQKKNITDKEFSSIFWWHLFICLISVLSIIMFAPYLAKIYKDPRITMLTYILSIDILIQMLANHPFIILKRTMQFRKIAIIRIIASLLSVILAISAAFLKLDYWSIVIRQLSRSLIIMLSSWICINWKPIAHFSYKSSRIGLKFAFSLYTTFIIKSLPQKIDKLILGAYYGAAVVGSYDRAFYFTSLPSAELIGPINALGQTSLSRLKINPNEYRIFYYKVLSLVSFIGFWLSGIFSLAGGDLLISILGAKWESAALLMMFLGPAIGPMMLYTTQSWLHVSLNQPGKYFRWSVFSVTILLSAIAISARYGVKYVAISYSALHYLLFPFAIWYAGRPMRITFHDIWSHIWQYLAAFVTCILLFIFINNNIPLFSSWFNSQIRIIRALIMILYCSILYHLVIIFSLRSIDPVKTIYSFALSFFKRNKEK